MSGPVDGVRNGLVLTVFFVGFGLFGGWECVALFALVIVYAALAAK